MPWILKKGALRSIRKQLKLSRQELQEMTGLSRRCIKRHEEDGDAPLKIQDASMRLYCKAFKPFNVEADRFATWIDHEEEPKVKAGTKRRAPVAPIHDPAAPKITTLTERAKQEAAIKAYDIVDVGGQKLEMVGNLVIREIMDGFKPFADKRFVVEGDIAESRLIPKMAMEALGGTFGEGTLFRIDREVREGLPVYVTVFAPSAFHVSVLRECVRQGNRVSMVVRVYVKEPDETWKGFFIFEKDVKPRPWCFVLDEIQLPTETHA